MAAHRKPAISSTLLQYPTMFGLAMIAMLWVSILHVLSIRHEATQKSSVESVVTFTRIFEEYVSSALHDADKTLLLLRAAYERSPSDFDLRAWAGSTQFKSKLDVQYALIGRDGIMVASNLGPTSNYVDLSDREHFRVHIDAKSDEMFVSKPVLGRASGKWTIQLSRKLRDKDGGFAGVIVSSLDPSHLSRFYESADLGQDGAITLVGFDGIIRARGGQTSTNALGRSMINSEVFSVYQTKPSGIVMGAGVVDGVRRLAGYRVVRDFPLLVTAAISEREIFAGFEADRRQYYIGGALLSVLITILMLAGARNKLQLDSTLIALAAERDRAQQASRAKSSFLAMMSHEIRTPMNAILGLASSLLEEPMSADQRSSLQTIYRAGDSLLEILNDILDYSKLEANGLVLEAIDFTPDEIGQLVLSIMGPRAAAKGLVIKSTYDPNLPQGLVGDPGRLRQILLNLVSNAVKFTSVGSVSLTCRCLETDGASATVEWSVADTGIGIAPEGIANLFSDYVQADSSIHRRFGGSGLGLSICKRMVEAMGGKIDVESELGRGTTLRFAVRLPIAAPAKDEARDDNDYRIKMIAAVEQLGRPLRILIADDNATNRLVAAKMLSEFKVQISMAGDGAEAVTAAIAMLPDVILMDMRMPEMDGPGASRAIRARGIKIPIIAFTANAYPEDIAECRSAGMGEFLPKPTRKPALINAILRSIGGGAVQAALPTAQPSLASPGEILLKEFDQTPLLDIGDYNVLAGELGEEAMAEACAAFFDETGTRLAALRACSIDSGRESLKREAHTIKGTAATFGYSRLSQLARWLEQKSAEIDGSDLAAAIVRLEDTFKQMQDANTAAVARAA